MNRPKSVTVICVVLLVLCVLNLLSIASGLWQGASQNLFKVPVAGAEAAIGLILTSVCALYMLRGANWARWLYLCWVGIGTIGLFFLANWLVILLGVIKTLVFSYFLTRADANEFFKFNRNEKEPQIGAT
jgi:hypothetical protein